MTESQRCALRLADLPIRRLKGFCSTDNANLQPRFRPHMPAARVGSGSCVRVEGRLQHRSSQRQRGMRLRRVVKDSEGRIGLDVLSTH